MATFPREVLETARKEHEVTLTTHGRKTGNVRRVVVWIATDGRRLYIRSGGGLGRDWPQNLLTRGKGDLELGRVKVTVRPRHVTDPSEARSVSRLYRAKYGSYVKPSKISEPLTAGEQASFELLPVE